MISWLAIALDAERLAQGVPRGEKVSVYESVARSAGQTTTTIKRALGALKFVREEAALAGLRLEEVKAPLSTIEAFKRVAKASRTTADQYARLILLGQMSFGSVNSLLQHVEMERKDRIAQDDKEVLIDISINLTKRMNKIKGIKKLLQRTEAGRLLKPDVEFESTKGIRFALYLSRHWPDTLFFEKSIEEMMRNMIAATVCYERVFFSSADQHEIDEAENYLLRIGVRGSCFQSVKVRR